MIVTWTLTLVETVVVEIVAVGPVVEIVQKWIVFDLNLLDLF